MGAAEGGLVIRTVLIDGDIVLFKFGFRHQEVVQWPGCEPCIETNEEQAYKDIDDFLMRLRMQTHCTEFKFIFTNKFNIRYKVLPSYKHNRVSSSPPIMLKILKDYIRATYPFETWKWCEADDVMGILGTQDPDKYVLATIDKDFLCLPATVYLGNKMDEPERISQDIADFNFHMQWLTGDSTDGYKGLKGVGKKRATKILWEAESADEMTERVLEAYMDRCWSREDCLAQARMARILRHTDWDWERKEPILWEP